MRPGFKKRRKQFQVIGLAYMHGQMWKEESYKAHRLTHFRGSRVLHDEQESVPIIGGGSLWGSGGLGLA